MLNSEKIIGYNTYSNILEKDKMIQETMEDSDYYNVTVNFVVKRNSKFASDQKTAPVQAV